MADRESALPPPVHVDLDDSVRDYWMARVASTSVTGTPASGC